MYEGALSRLELANTRLNALSRSYSSEPATMDKALQDHAAAQQKVEQMEQHLAEVEFEHAAGQIPDYQSKELKDWYVAAGDTERAGAIAQNILAKAEQAGIPLQGDPNQPITPEIAQSIVKSFFEAQFGQKPGMADYLLRR